MVAQCQSMQEQIKNLLAGSFSIPRSRPSSLEVARPRARASRPPSGRSSHPPRDHSSRQRQIDPSQYRDDDETSSDELSVFIQPDASPTPIPAHVLNSTPSVTSSSPNSFPNSNRILSASSSSSPTLTPAVDLTNNSTTQQPPSSSSSPSKTAPLVQKRVQQPLTLQRTHHMQLRPNPKPKIYSAVCSPSLQSSPPTVEPTCFTEA
uniref:Uncharacterized protein n=1 Tax=Nicotiana sylvestris TaxID=4096 RepID=A0A1U7VQP5_NICSY|nr:PREDICTED: putative protein TPRXL [Nicotiana sylvestris]